MISFHDKIMTEFRPIIGKVHFGHALLKQWMLCTINLKKNIASVLVSQKKAEVEMTLYAKFQHQ